MKNKYFFVVLIILFVFLSSCKPATPSEVVHLKIASYPYITEAPYFLAQDLGYFAEQGLEVEFVRFERSADVMPALANGDIDVSTIFPGAAVINAIARGASIKIVSGKGYLDPDACSYTALVARNELLENDFLADPQNWIGLKIATDQGGLAEYALETLLISNGLTLDNVEVVDLPVTNRLDALSNGAIDLAGAGEPWTTRIRNAGAGDVWMNYNQILPNYSWGLVGFGPSLLEDNPDAGRRFMVAFLKGLAKYNEGNTDENVAILAKYTQLEEEEIRNMCWIDMDKNGEMNIESVLEFQEWAVKRGFVEQPITAEQLWDPQFIEYAQKKVK